MDIITKHGLARSLLLEAVPGGALDKIRGEKGPVDFAAKMKTVLREHFPSVYERVDEKEFRLVDENAYTRVAINPEVRLPYTTFNNTLVLGCGDSVAINDPITGQGANTASFCAEQLFNTLMDNLEGSWDENVGKEYWSRIDEYVVSVSQWTNGMMGPLSESFIEAINGASSNQFLADRFVNLFHNPIAANNVFFNVTVKL
jgi:flavin-dependent dehydrogenase